MKKFVSEDMHDQINQHIYQLESFLQYNISPKAKKNCTTNNFQNKSFLDKIFDSLSYYNDDDVIAPRLLEEREQQIKNGNKSS